MLKLIEAISENTQIIPSPKKKRTNSINSVMLETDLLNSCVVSEPRMDQLGNQIIIDGQFLKIVQGLEYFLVHHLNEVVAQVEVPQVPEKHEGVRVNDADIIIVQLEFFQAG